MSPQRQPKAGDLIRLSVSFPPPVYEDIKAEALNRDMSYSNIVVERLEELQDLKRKAGERFSEHLSRAESNVRPIPMGPSNE